MTAMNGKHILHRKRYHKRKTGVLLNNTSTSSRYKHGRHKKIITWLVSFIVTLLFFHFAGLSFAEAPVRSFLSRFIPKPKPITQSSTIIPSTIQKAVENLAQIEIKQQEANSVLVSDNSNSNQPNQAIEVSNSIVEPLINTFQVLITKDPADRAKLRLKKIDRLTIELQNLLENDKSEAAVDRAVGLIKTIGEETDEVVADKNVQTDREILTMLISQYNRIQLVIQRLEENLPMTSLLKIEDARIKYLVTTAQKSINAAPNLDAIHNIATKEIEKIIGKDFTELKALEVISDFENGVKPEAKQKLVGLERQLAIEFEKRMLKLPHEVRTRKLQNYINLSYGDPLKQIKALNQIKNVFSDRDLILETEGLKELALKKLENRIFELNTAEEMHQFVDRVLENPEDIKVITQLQLQVDSGTDEKRKQQMNQIVQQAQGRLVEFFGKDKHAVEKIPGTDLVDMLTISNLNNFLKNIPTTSPDVTQALQDAKARSIKAFIQNVSKKDFISKPTLGYNPVGSASDMKLLLPNPQAIQILNAIKKELPASDQAELTKALKAESALVQEHILEHVNNPQIFKGYTQVITLDPVVNRTLTTYESRAFFNILSQKQKIIDKLAQQEDQALYEKMQQINQMIFATNGKSALEKQLPIEVQQEISNLKQKLADKDIPRLETPADVTLPEVATLPTTVQQAIIEAAREKISEADQAKLNLKKQAKDLGVPIPLILPDTPLYSFVKVARIIALVTKIDPVDRAKELLKQDNEKIIEAAKLVETNPSQKATNIAIDTLQSVANDFNTLKDHIGELTAVQKTEPQKVEELVDTMIDDGLSRQTVISQIENVVHGQEYVEVEKLRTDMVKDGIDLLLEVTDNNVEKLTKKLEETVKGEQAIPLEGLKAVELLNEIARTQPEDIQQILQTSESTIAQIVETKILAIPEEKRTQEILDYAQNQTGNPVRQLEAYDILKDNFDNPNTILLTEGLKDKVTENLIERISEISDEATRTEFATVIIGDQPQDLKAIIEIEARVAPPQNAGVVETLPIVGQVEDIKSDIEENIIDTYKNKPQELAQTDFYDNPTLSTTPDAADVQVAQELTQVLEQTPEVSKDVVKLAQKEEAKIIDIFVENISAAQARVAASTSAPTTVSGIIAKTLDPLPDTLVVLVDLKEELPAADQVKIDTAIETQVNLIHDHLVNTVTDPATFQAFIAQIEENPVAKTVVTQIGGTDFIHAVEVKAQEIATVAKEQETTLQTTVVAIQHEIFSTADTTPVVESLPVVVQQQINEIKQEVPVEQIPQVSVQAQTDQTTSVTVTTSTENSSVQVSTTESAPQQMPAPTFEPVALPISVQPTAIPQVPGL